MQLWHLTSLDAPTVAVVWMLAFARAGGVRLPFWLPATLALSAFTFYVADRLLDARSAARSAARAAARAAERAPDTLLAPHSTLASLRPRHHFHWRHRRVFLPAAIVSAITGLALVLHYMPLPARERNSLVAAATVFYFATVHTRLRSSLKSVLKLPKELLVGILFTVACVLPVAMRISPSARLELLLPTLAFILLAWLNCHAIEAWESSQPGRFRVGRLAIAQVLFASIVSIASVASVGVSITSVGAVAILLNVRIALLLLTAGVSGSLILWLDRVRGRLHPTSLRAAADLALLTPLLLFLN
jgi:hypothetical protein